MKDYIIEVLEEEKARLEAEKKKIENRDVPDDGCYLEIKKNKGKYVQYYKCKRENDVVNKSFIRKNDINTARMLAQKEFDKRLYADVSKRLVRIQSVLRYYKDCERHSLYTELSAERKALIQYDYIDDEHYLLRWLAQYSAQDAADSFKEKYPIETSYYTDNGEHVRSKSEKIIADKFAKEGIPYVYEPVCELNRKGVHPDFVLLNQETRQTYFYEHFGMMDKPEYAIAAVKKIAKYRELGYEYGKNLLYSFETGADGLNVNDLNRIILEHCK